MVAGHKRTELEQPAPPFGGSRLDPPGYHEGYWGGTQGNPKINIEPSYGEGGDYFPGVYRPEVKPGYQQDAERYQNMADGRSDRPAYQGNYRDFQYGQGHGQRALHRLSNAAAGREPSAAEIAGRAAMDQSLSSQIAAAGSVRGGPSSVASAYRNAARVNSANQAQMTAGIQAGRAGEMAQARDSYMRGALGYSGAALGRTQQELASELGQRSLNQSGEQFYERMAWDTKKAALDADLARAGMNQQSSQFNTQMDYNRDRAAQEDFWRTVGVVQAPFNAGIGGATGSDVRMKRPVEPMDAGQQRRDVEDIKYGPGTSSMLDERQQQQEQAYRDSWLSRYLESGGTAQRDPVAVQRDQDMKLKGTIERGDPYSHGEDSPLMAYSDERAKREAFMDGVRHADASMPGSTAAPKLPAYMDKAIPRHVESEPKRQLVVEKPATAPPGSAIVTTGAKGGLETSTEPIPKPAAPAQSAGKQVEVMTPKRLEVTRGGPPVTTPGRVLPREQALVRPGYDPREYSRQAIDRVGPDGVSRSHFEYSDDRTKEDAARRLEGSDYAYRDEYVPPEQSTGERNHGPMAQEMEKNPITATAVKKDPAGMRMVDMSKLVKTQSSLIAHLQEQIDELKSGRR